MDKIKISFFKVIRFKYYENILSWEGPKIINTNWF